AAATPATTRSELRSTTGRRGTCTTGSIVRSSHTPPPAPIGDIPGLLRVRPGSSPTVGSRRAPYGRPMSDTATPTQEQPPPPPPDGLPPAAAAGTPRIIGGVAATLADGLGIDALWIRIGFVLLALVGGFGLV